MKRFQFLRPALCLPALLLAAQPASAAELAAGTYQEAIRCAALNTIVYGAVKQADETKMSDDDKATAKAAQDHAIGWLTLAVGLNPKGEEATKADFGKDIDTIAGTITSAKDGGEIEQSIGADLKHCIAREGDLFK